MNNIADQIEQVRLNINHSCKEHQRDANKIRLLAVSKTHPASKIQEAYVAGITEFGESYLQEALEKIHVCKHLQPVWHFIGQLQSNKIRAIAEHFDWVQSLDNEKHLRRLNNQRSTHLKPLQVCVQVNFFNEPQKNGITPDSTDALLAICEEMPHINLRGLMIIPPKQDNFLRQLKQFDAVAEFYRHMQQKHPQMDTLSMGMSSDISAAICAGTNMLRIGTGIFGKR